MAKDCLLVDLRFPKVSWKNKSSVELKASEINKSNYKKNTAL
jgi:hypothetical protein